MSYIIEYEVCALVFLLIVTIKFFSTRRFSNKSNRMFGIILLCAILNVSLDLAGAYLIENADRFTTRLAFTVNSLFFIVQTAFPAIMLLYVITLSGHAVSKRAVFSIIPAAICEVLLLVNPYTGWLFYFQKTQDGTVYTHGFLFLSLYLVSAFYILLTVVWVLQKRRSFRKAELRSVLMFIIIIVAAVGIQVIYPRLLLTGAAISVAVFLMFLTMQNPETMLDSITGTFNYSALIQYLRRQITDNRPIWVTAVDIGGLRKVNSTLGVHAGNELLESVGQYIHGICTRREKAFRMIGTRFVIVSDCVEDNIDKVNKITERFKNSWSCGNSEVALIATVRYSDHKNDFIFPEDVLNLIDLAYSKTATEGFGNTRVIDMEQLKLLHRKGQVKDALRRAVQTVEGFYLNYQPLYSVRDNRFCGAEALLRFKDPELGQISPAEFIPVAEETDLIYQIDSLVIKKACTFLRSHPELFNAGLRVLEINLSAAEFNCNTERIYSDIVSNIESIENRICFEVTETAVTTRREALSDFMHRLIERGVRFAIDDFGTGYANITQLAKLPFSIVKLDRIFVSQNNSKETMILRDLVNMFDHIGLSTVFEGVETVEQAEFAADIGVDQIQGYYYSHPLTEDELIKLIITESGKSIAVDRLDILGSATI